MNQAHGPVVEEVVTRLIVNGETLFEWRCTPADLKALALGRLYIEGFIESTDDVLNLDIRRLGNGEIEVSIEHDLQILDTGRVSGRSDVPDTDTFAVLFKSLFAAVDAHHPDGGVHAAALAAHGAIAYQAEDVGRHNAVDKAIGLALLDRAMPAAYGLLVSSRVSGEIAHKAARAGVAWLASRSIPTTLAVATAHEAGLPLIGRAAGKGANVY